MGVLRWSQDQLRQGDTSVSRRLLPSRYKQWRQQLEPRARGAIALYEAGDYDANWWVFHVDTKKVVIGIS